MDPRSEVTQEIIRDSDITPPASDVSLMQHLLTEQIDAGTRRAVNRMLFRDTVMTLGFLALLWTSYAIVSIAIRPIIVIPAVYALFLVCIVLVTIYNTVSLLAMVRNMRRDRLFIYVRDILNLRDARRRAAQGGKDSQTDAAELVVAATADEEG